MAKDNTKLIGKLELQIDSLETKAILTFKKNQEKDVWDTDSIYKLILANGIASPITKTTLEKNIQTWVKLPKDEFSLQVAAGIPPEETLHETIDWRKFDIPEDLLKKAETFFAGAPLPEIYNILKEKVKVEKVVKQKSLLPFLPGKEEKVSQWEIVEKRIPVDINPAINVVGFVNKGDVIAKLIPGRIGKPGRNIYDKPIPPEKVKKAALFTGNGVIKSTFEIKAAETGFLRCGENWVDILPFKLQATNVYLSPDKKYCYLDYTPGESAEYEQELELIFQKAEALGFARPELIKSEELEKLILAAKANRGSVEKKILNSKSDAFIGISISQDKTRAELTLVKPGADGKELDLKEVGRQINNLKITGLNKEKLQKDILAFYKGQERALRNYILVEGKPPVRGKDGRLDFACSFMDSGGKNEILVKLKNDHKRIKLESESKFPLTGIGELAYVEKNQKIGDIIPPSYGQPGVDIYGNEIPPLRGNDPDLNICENTIISKNTILATVNGVLETGKIGNTTLLRVRETQDARIDIKISETRTKAYLTLYPVKGIGKTATIQDIDNELQRLGITKGIKREKFADYIKRVQKEELVKDEIIAEGMPPVHGTGKRLLFHVKIAAGNPMLLGALPEEQLGNGLYIKKASIIAEIFPPAIQPRDGWDIAGAPLPANTGVVIDIEAGKNVKTITEDTGVIKFIAEIDGEVFYNGKIVEIKDQQVVEGDVRPEQGNVSYPGSVRINGSILAGAKVFSGGNINVKHNIQEAVVSADGVLHVGNDIIGNRRTVLRSKSDITFNSAEAAIILSVGNVNIKNRCLHSTIKCNGRVIHDSGSGVLVGGIIKAKKGMELTNLGSKDKIQTYISFGQDYLISDQIEIEEKEIRKLNKQIEIYDAQVKDLESKADIDREAVFKIRKAKRLALKTIEKRNGRLFMLREKFEEHFPSEIIIKGKICPGVTIESHGRILEIQSEKEKLIIYFNTDSGKIEEKLLNQSNS